MRRSGDDDSGCACTAAKTEISEQYALFDSVKLKHNSQHNHDNSSPTMIEGVRSADLYKLSGQTTRISSPSPLVDVRTSAKDQMIRSHTT